MIRAATDAELVEGGWRCQDRTIHLFADRLNHRIVIVEDARKELTKISNSIDSLDPESLRQRLAELTRKLDWRYEIPDHPQTTADLRKQHKIIVL